MNKLMYVNMQKRILRDGKTENLQIFGGVCIEDTNCSVWLQKKNQDKSVEATGN